MRFDLVDLRLFLNVAEAASITHGAAKTNLALASASERIRGMEELLGVSLLERGRRGVEPTPAGRALLHHARIVTRQIERMRGELSGFSGGLKGQVRLLSNTAALSELLPEILGGFLAAHPNIDIDLEEQPSYDIVRLVADGFAEIGIAADFVDHAGLESLPFATDRLVLVTPHRHPLARRRSHHFRDLLDHDFVGLDAASALQQHLAEHAVQAGRPLKLRVRLRSFDAVCRMVENGIGIAVIPETAARRSAASMGLRMARLADPWSTRELSICLRSFDALSVQARQLVEHLRLNGPKAVASR